MRQLAPGYRGTAAAAALILALGSKALGGSLAETTPTPQKPGSDDAIAEQAFERRREQ